MGISLSTYRHIKHLYMHIKVYMGRCILWHSEQGGDPMAPQMKERMQTDGSGRNVLLPFYGGRGIVWECTSATLHLHICISPSVGLTLHLLTASSTHHSPFAIHYVPPNHHTKCRGMAGGGVDEACSSSSPPAVEPNKTLSPPYCIQYQTVGSHPSRTV